MSLSFGYNSGLFLYHDYLYLVVIKSCETGQRVTPSQAIFIGLKTADLVLYLLTIPSEDRPSTKLLYIARAIVMEIDTF